MRQEQLDRDRRLAEHNAAVDAKRTERRGEKASSFATRIKENLRKAAEIEAERKAVRP